MMDWEAQVGDSVVSLVCSEVTCEIYNTYNYYTCLKINCHTTQVVLLPCLRNIYSVTLRHTQNYRVAGVHEYVSSGEQGVEAII